MHVQCPCGQLMGEFLGKAALGVSVSPISLLRQRVDGEALKSCELLYFRPALGFPGMGRGGLAGGRSWGDEKGWRGRSTDGRGR